jgi:hypothetical protein
LGDDSLEFSVSRNTDFKEYPQIRGRSSSYKDQSRLVPLRQDQPENRDDARSEWLAVGDFLLLVGLEQGSGEQMDRERQPEQGTVGHDEERS